MKYVIDVKENKKYIEKLVEKTKKKDERAFSELCRIYRPFIIRICRKFKMLNEDTMNAGMFGLYEAAIRYKKNKKNDFFTFAYYWVMRRIRDEAYPFYKRKMENISRMYITEADYIFEDGLTLEDVKEKLPLINVSTTATIIIEKIFNQLREICGPRSKVERNIEILKAKFGIDGEGPLTYEELSFIYKISPQRLRAIVYRNIQIIKEAIKKGKIKI